MVGKKSETLLGKTTITFCLNGTASRCEAAPVEGAGWWEIKNYISVNGGYVCVQRCSVHLWEDCVGLVGSLVLYFVFSLGCFPSSSRSREKGPDDWEGPLPRRSSILTVNPTSIIFNKFSRHFYGTHSHHLVPYSTYIIHNT
jgi:hypothetical protein